MLARACCLCLCTRLQASTVTVRERTVPLPKLGQPSALVRAHPLAWWAYKLQDACSPAAGCSMLAARLASCTICCSTCSRLMANAVCLRLRHAHPCTSAHEALPLPSTMNHSTQLQTVVLDLCVLSYSHENSSLPSRPHACHQTEPQRTAAGPMGGHSRPPNNPRAG